MSSSAAILVDAVSKRYRGGVQALSSLSLEIEQGEIFGLLGRNGAGKTTLVKILLDIVRPSQGSTQLLGRDSRRVDARRDVGYLPEDHRFPEYRTAAATLDFYAQLSGVSASDRRKRIPELLDLVRLGHAARQKVRSFSKGMKQRLGLAQALVHDPVLLFLDEPTDGVDPVGRAEIKDALVDLKERGKTIFINSHLLGEVEEICDRVAILDKGVLQRLASIEELTKTTDSYSIVTEPPADEGVIAKIAGAGISARLEAEGLVLELESGRIEDLDRCVDALRAAGLGIRHLVRDRQSLEQAFLDLVGAASEEGA